MATRICGNNRKGNKNTQNYVLEAFFGAFPENCGKLVENSLKRTFEASKFSLRRTGIRGEGLCGQKSSSAKLLFVQEIWSQACADRTDFVASKAFSGAKF